MKEQIFKGQREGEEFLFMFRKHIIAMRKGFYLFLGVFAISCLPTFFMLTSDNLMDALWIAFGGFIVGLILFFYQFMLWYYSLYIVSNERIRQITQKGFFGRKMMDLPLGCMASMITVHSEPAPLSSPGDLSSEPQAVACPRGLP